MDYSRKVFVLLGPPNIHKWMKEVTQRDTCLCILFLPFIRVLCSGRSFVDLRRHSRAFRVANAACKKASILLSRVTPQRIRQRILEPHALNTQELCRLQLRNLIHMPRELTENAGKFSPPLSVRCEAFTTDIAWLARSTIRKVVVMYRTRDLTKC